MPEPAEESTAELFMAFLDSSNDMMDLMDGYRAKLIGRGYSDGAAEQMVVQLHGNFMLSLSRSV